jgi:hypothetical protein
VAVGTSLSKVFGAIARFSEDVDITLDYRGLDGSFDPFAAGVSNNQLRKFSDSRKSFVREHAQPASMASMTSGSPVFWMRISLMPMPPRDWGPVRSRVAGRHPQQYFIHLAAEPLCHSDLQPVPDY